MPKSRIFNVVNMPFKSICENKIPGKFPNLQYVLITGAADDNFCAIILDFLGE